MIYFEAITLGLYVEVKLGYVKGNVWVISWRANHIKCNASLAELEKLVIALRKFDAGEGIEPL